MPTPPPPATARPPREPVAAALLCVAVVLVGLVSYRWLSAPQAASPDTDAPLYLINVNTAGAAELALLPGIGPAKAEAIVAERAAHGPFAGPDDLRRVHGIGDKLPKRLAGYLRF